MPTAFITGAGSGIGRAVAVALDEAGYDVLAAGRNRVALDELGAAHPRIAPVFLDMSDRDALADAVEGREIDVLVNNAGIMPPLGPFADMATADIDAALEINLRAAIHLTRLVVPGMRERGRGHLVFTGSIAGHAPFSNIAVYSATKAALGAFAAALRTELSPHGVRVTEIVAGRVETRLYDEILDAEARAAMYASKVVQPADVASMLVAVLALPQWADVTRFDIMPTWPTSPSGTK